MFRKKIFIILSLIIIALFILINFNSIRSSVRSLLSPEIKIFVKELFFGKQFIEEISYFKKIHYNQKVLPETEFENINLKIYHLNDLENINNEYNQNISKFFIETLDRDLIIVTAKGEIKFVEDLRFENIRNIKSNINKFRIYGGPGTQTGVMDISLINKKLFISFASKKDEKDKCTFFTIIQADFNENNLKFENFFQTNECLANTYGGRMVQFNLNNENGILFTTGASVNERNLAQNDNSYAGKILFINFNKSPYKIISKGHRVPQGLFVEKETILVTEHGPYGGDEINKILLGGNYGWPIASYGERYDYIKILNTRSDYVYKKNHLNLNFIEPIFSFVPSIGISEIIKIPNEFSKYWQNNYFISSLNGVSLYRTYFDKNFSKVIFYEKIPIGERIRDIKYISSIKSFALALEDTGSIGLLSLSK